VLSLFENAFLSLKIPPTPRWLSSVTVFVGGLVLDMFSNFKPIMGIFGTFEPGFEAIFDFSCSKTTSRSSFFGMMF
jgi:hypothetical protein